MNTLDIQSPIGPIYISEAGGYIKQLSFGQTGRSDSSPLLLETKRQLEEYFAGDRRSFDLPLCPEGTEFQKKVWAALEKIPYGETRCYGDIAAEIGSPKASRAVGMANHNNPIAIIIPCHRVIGKDGSLTGYGGGLNIKQILLALEAGERKI